MPKPVFAQTPGPSCPTGTSRYGNSYLCASPQAVAFCDSAYSTAGIILQNAINRVNFTGSCLEKFTTSGNNVQTYCQTLSIFIGGLIPIASNPFTIPVCTAVLQPAFASMKVTGLINPVYSPDCGSDNSGVKTGLGCLSTNPQILVNSILPWAVGIGSGIAFLLGLYGALMIVISAGDPEKMQAGKEMITSAVSGLLIIIFAVFILKFIGVDILQLFDVNNNN